MKKIFYLLLLVTTFSFAQGTIVKIHGKATESELNDAQIWTKIHIKQKQLAIDIDAAGFRRIFPKTTFYTKQHCKDQLELIQKRKNLMNSINYRAKAIEIDNLYKKLSTKSSSDDYVKNYNSELHEYDEAEKILLNKIADIENKSKKEKIRKKKALINKNLLEEELSELEETSDLSKGLSKNKSLDDFLSENNLNKKSAKTENDFLSEENIEHDSDFLNKEEKSSIEKFKITSKNGKMGVVDENGKILIPFKFERIINYSNGFASVSKTIETLEVDSGKYKNEASSGFVFVLEVGFVGADGEYLDKPTLKLSSREHMRLGYLDVYTKGQEPSKEAKRIAKRRKATFLAKKMREAKNKLINKYNIK